MPTYITDLEINISKNNNSNPEFTVSGSNATLAVWGGDKNITNSRYFPEKIVGLLKEEGVNLKSIKNVIVVGVDEHAFRVHLNGLKNILPNCSNITTKSS
jgi:hypothetical protein